MINTAINRQNLDISNSNHISCKCGNRTKFEIKFYESSLKLKILCKKCNNYLFE